jgi:hypothetical protein
MNQVSNLRIPEFIYLDNQKVDMTLSWMEGGIPVRSRSQKSSTKSKSGGGNLGFQGFIGAHGGLESTSGEQQEEMREQNDYSKFARLYKLLQERDGVTTIDKLDEKVFKKLQRGQVIEIESYITLSPIDKLMGFITKFMPLMTDEVTDADEDLAAIKAIITLFQQTERKEIEAFIESEEHPDYRLYMSLLIDKFRASTDELPAKLFIFGRIAKILSENDTENLMSKYLGGLNIPENSLLDIVSQFSSDHEIAQIFGGVPSLDDMVVKYPAIELSPIALYR